MNIIEICEAIEKDYRNGNFETFWIEEPFFIFEQHKFKTDDEIYEAICEFLLYVWNVKNGRNTHLLFCEKIYKPNTTLNFESMTYEDILSIVCPEHLKFY